MAESDRHIIREEEWYRLYASSRYPQIYESKFATGEAEISLPELESRWQNWDEGSKIQFSQAFGMKQTLSSDDEKVLDFLIDKNGEMISSSIALLATKHSNKQRVIQFLVDCLKAFSRTRGNFLLALSVLAAPEAAPVLSMVFEESRSNVAKSHEDYDSIVDLLNCSAALFKILGETKYLDVIASYLQHPNERVRSIAQQCSFDLARSSS